MKVSGNGQAKILSDPEKKLLFERGLQRDRDRALFGVCLYTGCRISEALALEFGDIREGVIVFRRAITKGKKNTRAVPVHDKLVPLLRPYLLSFPLEERVKYIFPGGNGVCDRPLTRAAADLILRKACDRVGLEGISTHSFRRTALTHMANAGVPLSVIQRISGHRNLATLQRYLAVTPTQLEWAVESV